MTSKKIFTGMMLFLLLAGSAAAEPYRFAVICDTRSDANNSGTNGVNVAAVMAVCRDLKKNKAQFVLAPGDFICGNVRWYRPTPPPLDSQYQAFIKAAASQGVGLPGSGKAIVLFPARGNHENYHDLLPKRRVMQAWTDHIGKHLPENGPAGETGFSYWFRWKNDLFIAVDEYMHVDDKQKGIRVNQAWLDKVLETQGGRVFVFGHTPAFAAHHTDCLGENPAARDRFLESIFNQSGAYFCGHDHFYARAKIPVYGPGPGSVQGFLRQVITPSGAPFLTGNRGDNHKWNGRYRDKNVIAETYIDNFVGYQLVSVDDNRVTVQFIATPDACSYFIDDKGVYHYTYRSDWENWKFALKDQFSYYRKEQPAKAGSKIKVIVDTDMGWDDVLSILYLVKNPAIDIIGITVTGCGETHLDDGVQLALALMELGGQDAVVCAGTDKPTSLDHKFPKDFRDDMDQLMGLRKTLPKPTRPADPRPAWDFLSETLNHADENISILSIGGYTNLAKMMERHPGTDLGRLKSVYTMGGAVFVDGNIALLNNARKSWDQGPIYSSNWAAEWNMFVDPVAAKKVFDSSIPITLVPLGACDYVMLDKSFIKKITADDPVATLAKNIFIKKTGGSSEGIPVPIFDPLATLILAGAIDSSQVHQLAIDVLTVDSNVDNTCGQTYVVHDPGRKVCNVVQGVSAHQFGAEYARIINLGNGKTKEAP